jgi:hypothetical protein
MAAKEGTKLKVEMKRGRSLDPSDPGFTIPGHQFRWVSSVQTENKVGRIWKLVRKEDLSQEVIEQVESRRPNAFDGGNTIRWGSNVLAYAPNELVDQARAETDRSAVSQMNMIKAAPNNPNITVDKKETEVRRVGAEEFNT